MYLIGYDIGSSSVKASLVEAITCKCMASAFYPKVEQEIMAVKPGWAEQDPEMWWQNLQMATADLLQQSRVDASLIKAIGISYQMHGLVCVDKDQQVLRPSIIWCDSRAVETGDTAFREIGTQHCLEHLLNSPGNFTASKLRWVKDHEPATFERIDKIMLPGDYIAMRLTGQVRTTISGLSEGIFWDIRENRIAQFLMDYYGLPVDVIPAIVPTFGEQGQVTDQAAQELGLRAGTQVCYRAGDQPNNAFSLNVLEPGEIAATAGTSGVVYGVSEEVKYDPHSRVNTFVHVNHTPEQTRLGVLLCVSGTGILNSWLKRNITSEHVSYADMNKLAAQVPIGSDGLSVLPFGNGAERMLLNRELGAQVLGVGFNTHQKAHLVRAGQEGIVFAFRYGMEVMESIGISLRVIRAGHANMFLSPVFRDTLAGVSGASIEMFDTDGSVGAAKGAGLGAGIYQTPAEAFGSLNKLAQVDPNLRNRQAYRDAYETWKNNLNNAMNAL